MSPIEVVGIIKTMNEATLEISTTGWVAATGLIIGLRYHAAADLHNAARVARRR